MLSHLSRARSLQADTTPQTTTSDSSIGSTPHSQYLTVEVDTGLTVYYFNDRSNGYKSNITAYHSLELKNKLSTIQSENPSETLGVLNSYLGGQFSEISQYGGEGMGSVAFPQNQRVRGCFCTTRGLAQLEIKGLTVEMEPGTLLILENIQPHSVSITSREDAKVYYIYHIEKPLIRLIRKRVNKNS